MFYKELNGPKGPTDCLEAFEFKGKDAKRTISRVALVKVEKTDKQGKPTGAYEYKAHMFFKNTEGKESGRYYDVPKSVRYGLSLKYGVETDGWTDKEVTLYPTECFAFGEIQPCLRIRVSEDHRKKIIIWMKKHKSSERMYEIIQKESR